MGRVYSILGKLLYKNNYGLQMNFSIYVMKENDLNIKENLCIQDYRTTCYNKKIMTITNEKLIHNECIYIYSLAYITYIKT